MSNVDVYSEFDPYIINDYFGILLSVTVTSSTQFKQVNTGIFASTLIFSGTYTLNGGNITGGTITSLEILDGSGNEVCNITGLSATITGTSGGFSFYKSDILQTGSTYYAKTNGDYITGYGNDTYIANTGTTISPGGGVNTIVANGTGVTVDFSGAFSSYSLTTGTNGSIMVADSILTRNGYDYITGSATLKFTGDSSEVLDNAGVLTLVGVTAAAASSELGISGLTVDVSDTAANVATNLDSLQALQAAGALGGISLTGSGTPTLTITVLQLTNDAKALTAITGPFNLAVAGVSVASAASTLTAAHVTSVSITDSAANVQSSLDTLEGLAVSGKLGSITLTDAGTPTLTLTASQVSSDAAVLHDISGSYTLAVSDSAANVVSNLDTLEAAVKVAPHSSITLTNSGTPTLTVTSAQLVSDAAALNAITSPYTLSVSGVSSASAAFILQEDASGRGSNGIALDNPGIAPTGGNSVVGFQNASFTSGYDVVVLSGPRSDYAIQVAADGTTTIKDIGAGDATNGQTVTVSGASYLIFDGGASTKVAGLPTYNQIYFIETPADAQLAQFYAAATQFKSSIALSGLEYWENQLAGGMSLNAIAQSFLNTSYFQTTYGSPGTTHAQHVTFVQALYENILGMNLSATNGGVQYWATDMDNGMSAASALISFTNATAQTSTINAVAGGTAGAGLGWLIDPSVTGGYADPGVQEAAATVLAKAGSGGFYNLSLIDPTTVTASGLSGNGVTLTPGAISVAASASAVTVYLSASFTQATIANSGSSIHDGSGRDVIIVTGSGDTVTLGSATTDTLNLSNANGAYVFNFTPAKGSVLAMSGITNPTATTLLNGTTTQVQGSALTFAGSSPIYVNIGTVGGDSPAEVVTAANAAYKVAGVTGEHVVFIGTDSGGNTDVWSYKTDGSHQVDSGAITQIATIIGVAASSLTAADLA